MGIFDAECSHCGSKEHATSDCPHPFYSSNCFHCGSTEHTVSDCPHPFYSDKCSHCGSPEHTVSECPHPFYSEACSHCGSTEHSVSDCPHSFYQDECSHCGSNNHATSDCPHGIFSRRSSYAPSSSSSSGEGWWVVPLVGLCIGLAVIIAIVWLAIFIVIPVAFLNSALILTVLAIFLKNRRTLFAALAIVGGVYMVIDVGVGLLSALFVNNVVHDRIWLTAFIYLNAIAAGVSAWFLVQPLWQESVNFRETDRQKSILMMIGAIALVAAPVVGLPLIYNILPVQATSIDTRAGIPQTRTTSAPIGQRPNTSNAAASSAAPVTTNVGQSGSLLTNVNLRSCADRTCDSLGEHFKDAKFRILETLDKDGILWYKIEITQKGCHALNPSWCGKKLIRDRKNQAEVNRSSYLDGDNSAADSGWINSYNKELNVYTVRLD